MTGRQDHVQVDLFFVRDAPDHYIVALEEGGPTIALPKRLCRNLSVIEPDIDCYEFEVPEWLAQKEGMI